MNNLLLGYVISVIVGIPVTYVWSEFIHSRLEKYRTDTDAPAERIWWIPLLIGVFERAIITTLVAFPISGAAGFIGAWVAVKSAGGWAVWNKGTTYGRAVLFAGLLGSAMSIIFGLSGGIIITALNSTTIVGTTPVMVSDIGTIAQILSALATLGAVVYAAMQVKSFQKQLRQIDTHNLMAFSNQHNWNLLDHQLKEPLPPALPSWKGLNRSGWAWRVLHLDHLNLLFLAYQDRRIGVMDKADLEGWVLKAKYWFGHLQPDSSDQEIRQGYEVLKQILNEAVYPEYFCKWLVKKKIIGFDLLAKGQ